MFERKNQGLKSGNDKRAESPRGENAKAAGIGDRRNQVSFRNPGHGATHNRELATEYSPPARPQLIELGAVTLDQSTLFSLGDSSAYC